MPPKNKYGEIIFKDYKDFKPNLTPREIFMLGSFGGTYWRPIKSKFYKHILSNQHKKYQKSWWKDIDDTKLVSEWKNYDVNINKYKVYCGSTLEDWETSEWIIEKHPYGWVQWYCDFYKGNRCDDDERQIQRWKRTAGPNSRFRKKLINLIISKNTKYNNFNISPKIRQTLQHWGYYLTEKDFIEEYNKKYNN